MIVLIIVSVTQPFPESPLSSPSSTFSSDSIPLPGLITHHLETIDARFSAKMDMRYPDGQSTPLSPHKSMQL
jgi:hypothetical protein